MFEGNVPSVERWFRDLIRSSFAYANISGRQWNGALTLTYQPAFLAYNSVTDADVTGNNTVVTIDFDTEVFDQGDNFSGDTFTAPVAGKYRFSTVVRVQQLTNATTINLRLLTSNRAYMFYYRDAGAIAANGDMAFGGSVLADMDAGDTAVVQLVVNGIGADTADIWGTTAPQTYFSGELVC